MSDVLSIIIAIVGSLVGIIGCVVGVYTAMRNKRNDDATSGQQIGLVMSELGYVKGNTDDIKKKLDAQDARNLDFEGRLSKNEMAIQSAHDRINVLSDKILTNPSNT